MPDRPAPLAVLAFSGGLDTSYCVLELRRRGYRVHTAFADSGGTSAKERAAIAHRARELGAVEHHELDIGQDLWDEFIVPLLRAQARFQGQYPLLCSDRYLIVKRCLELAGRLGAAAFAHGCTGMGNDQLRFDQTARSLGDWAIVAPIRDLLGRVEDVRTHEEAALRELGFAVPERQKRYSINENLLGVTISGSEIDRFEAPADDARRWCRPRAEWPAAPLTVRLAFERGVPVALDGEPLPGPELLARLNAALGAYGVGRFIYTGDVTIGLKGRILFECPGLTGLLTAAEALGDAVSTRFQNAFRRQVAERWAELVYSGFFYEPLKRDLDAYLAAASERFSGEVTLATDGGAVQATALASPYLLRSKDAVYAQRAAWSAAEAEGFIKLTGLSSLLHHRVACDERENVK